jgi:hypothetical protein
MKVQWKPAGSIVCLMMLSVTVVVNAQSKSKCDTQSGKVGCLFPNLLAGETVQSTTHDPSFPNGDFEQNLSSVGTGIATQLSSVPVPATGSGYTYMFNIATGEFTRSSETFGPILIERGEMLGRKRAYFGFSYQSFSFNSIDGLDLHNIGVVFKHRFDPNLEPDYLKDVITANNNVSLNMRQFATVLGYGVTDRFDVSVAVPTISVHLSVTSSDTIQRIGSKTDRDPMTGTPIHYFANTSGDMSMKQFQASSNASGIGDLVFRAKFGLKKWGEETRLAVATDIRVPTGDEYNYLGSGAFGLKPFLVLSSRFNRISPHVNVGFQWNSRSVLAGDLQTGLKGHLPYELPYNGGVEIGIFRRLTANFDILARENFHVDRFVSQRYDRDGVNFPDVNFKKSSVNQTDGAVGFRLNPFGKLILHANVLFKMNDGGLRDNVTPLIGLTYTP